mmetsp:Transcript_44394/g.105153  ORF Transcript_44394/g.105153 Transcript_44394/m.105153 type:complete len:266 (-) Transcript_44394:357-1154(-)
MAWYWHRRQRLPAVGAGVICFHRCQRTGCAAPTTKNAELSVQSNCSTRFARSGEDGDLHPAAAAAVELLDTGENHAGEAAVLCLLETGASDDAELPCQVHYSAGSSALKHAGELPPDTCVQVERFDSVQSLAGGALPTDDVDHITEGCGGGAIARLMHRRHFAPKSCGRIVLFHSGEDVFTTATRRHAPNHIKLAVARRDCKFILECWTWRKRRPSMSFHCARNLLNCGSRATNIEIDIAVDVCKKRLFQHPTMLGVLLGGSAQA